MGTKIISQRAITALLSIVTLSILTFSAKPVSAQIMTEASNTTHCDATTSVFIPEQDNLLVVAPAGQTWSILEKGPFPITLSSGTYDINYVSFDNHSEKGGQGQEFEQWYVEGYYQGVKVYTSAITADIPEDSDYAVGSIGTKVNLPAIDSILIKHALTVDEDGRYPQSVHPRCVEFEKHATEEPPVCPEKPTKPSKLCPVGGDNETPPVTPPTPPAVVTPAPQVKSEVVATPPTLAETGISSMIAVLAGMIVVTGAYSARRIIRKT